MIINQAAKTIKTNRHFFDLIDILNENDVLVLNNSKVFPARMIGKKPTGGKIEIFLLNKIRNNNWQCLGGGKRKQEKLKITFPGLAGILVKQLDESIWEVKFNKNPLPVALAIAVKDKKFLLIKRGLAPKKGMWASPSGFIEVGETPEEACLRELKEEAGASGQIVRLIRAVRVADKEVYGDMLILEYLVKVVDDNLIPGDEVEEVKFFDIDELPGYFVDFFKEIIEEIKVEG